MKKGIIIVLIIFTIALIQIQYQNVRTSTEINLNNQSGEYSNIEQVTPKITYTSTSPIYITSNSDFGTLSVPGNGTETHPYVITNKNITNSTVNPIYIENTDAYFKISSCLLDSEDWIHDVISLLNVSNGLIEENLIKNGLHGIILNSGCRDIVIDENTIINNSNAGIGHINSFNNNITNNDISLSGFKYSTSGIASSNINSGSSIQQGGGQGVYLDPSNFTLISGNSIHHNEDDGITLEDSHNITIEDNCIYYNGFNVSSGSSTLRGPISYKIQQGGGQGVYLDPSHNNTIHLNIFFCNEQYGVWIEQGMNNTVTSNDFFTNNLTAVQARDDNTDPTYTNIFNDNFWSEYSSSNPYPIDGAANNNDSNPRDTILTKICITGPCPPTTDTSTTNGSNASSFSFNVLILSLLTVTLIVKKKPKFRR